MQKIIQRDQLQFFADLVTFTEETRNGKLSVQC